MTKETQEGIVSVIDDNLRLFIGLENNETNRGQLKDAITEELSKFVESGEIQKEFNIICDLSNNPPELIKKGDVCVKLIGDDENRKIFHIQKYSSNI